MNIFGIVDADSLVRDDPLYPFMVYGIGVLVCAIALVPLRIQLVKRRKTMWAIYPLCQKALAKVLIRVMRPVAAIVVVGFVVLCVVKFS